MTLPMQAMLHHGATKRIDFKNTTGSALVVGEIVDIGQRIGVCTSPEGVPASGVGQLGALSVEGVFKIKKATNDNAAAWNGKDGEVYWDTVAKTAYNAPGSNRIYAGLSVEPASIYMDHVVCDINKVAIQSVMQGFGSTTTSTSTTTTT